MKGKAKAPSKKATGAKAARPKRKPSGSVWAVEDLRRMTATQMGRVFGISRQAFSVWRECPRNTDGTWSLPEVVAWKLRRVQEELELEADGSGADSPALERYRAARADRAELEVLEKRDALVSRTDVEARWGRVLAHIVQAFDGLGKVIAPRLARRDEKEIAQTIRAEIHRAIDTARNEMLEDGEI